METRPKPFILEGTATISAMSSEVTVTHNKGVTNQPQVTPTVDPEQFWYVPIADITVNSFKIVLASTTFTDKTFNYKV
jgi:hypothetical protein